MTASDIEKVIEHPDLGQVDLLLGYEWLVPFRGGEIWLQDDIPEFPTYYIFTSIERMAPFLELNQHSKEYEENPYPLVTPDGWNIPRPAPYQSAVQQWCMERLSGRDIFSRLGRDGGYHEVLVNAGCETYDEPRRHGSLRIPCGWTPLFAEGLEARPEARILPARSIAEIHLFMGMFHLNDDHLEHRLEYLDGQLCAVYEGKSIDGKLFRQAFTPVSAQEDLADFGPGASAILCAGMLCHRWHSVKSFLQSDFEADWAHGLLRQLDEVLKMLDPTTDRLGPESFRHPIAPSFIKSKPHVITGAYLRQERKELARLLALP